MFNYLSLPYCSMGFSPALGTLFLLFWAGVLALWLSTAAEFFLCVFFLPKEPRAGAECFLCVYIQAAKRAILFILFAMSPTKEPCYLAQKRLVN